MSLWWLICQGRGEYHFVNVPMTTAKIGNFFETSKSFSCFLLFGHIFPLFSVKMTFFGKNAKKVAKKFGGFIKKLLSLQTHKL